MRKPKEPEPIDLDTGDKSIQYRELKRWKYETTREHHFNTEIIGYEIRTEYACLYKDGLMIIGNGYAWDGPSGPTIDTPDTMRGSLVHDALYQLMRMGLLPQDPNRKIADDLLYHCLLEDGMTPLLAYDFWLGARLGGSSSAKTVGPQDDQVVIITAP